MAMDQQNQLAVIIHKAESFIEEVPVSYGQVTTSRRAGGLKAIEPLKGAEKRNHATR